MINAVRKIKIKDCCHPFMQTSKRLLDIHMPFFETRRKARLCTKRRARVYTFTPHHRILSATYTLRRTVPCHHFWSSKAGQLAPSCIERVLQRALPGLLCLCVFHWLCLKERPCLIQIPETKLLACFLDCCVYFNKRMPFTPRKEKKRKEVHYRHR